MSEPSGEEIRAAFTGLPKIPGNASRTTSNIICAECWVTWLRTGHNWRGEMVEIVTLYQGNALCEKHLRVVAGITDD